MHIGIDTIFSAQYLTIEVDGEQQILLAELDTETGAAKTYVRKDDGGLLMEDGEFVLKDIVLPVDKLHVYLVKPKQD